MADHKSSSTKHARGTHIGDRNLERSGLVMSSEDSHKFENRSDRDDWHNSHGSSRTSREEQRVTRQEHPQTVRGTDGRRYTQYDYNSDRSTRYAESNDRLSGSVMKDRWTSHDRPKTINSHGRVDDREALYDRESSNGHRRSYPNTSNERHRPTKGQERYERKDKSYMREKVHEKRHDRGNEYFQQSHDSYNHREEEQGYEEAKSPACTHSYSPSDITSLKVRHKDRGNSGKLDEQTEQYPSTADRSEQRHRHKRRHHNSSHGRPSSGGSSSHSVSSASDDTDDSRDSDTPKEGSFPGRHQRDRRRSGSPSHSGRRPRSGSHHRGRSHTRSPSGNQSSTQKYGRSGKHSSGSGKRKNKDRSTSREERKRRKHKDREPSREKEKMKKRDEERRSVLTGKKIKLKVKKDKGDHERDANRKDLLQFLNSAFE